MKYHPDKNNGDELSSIVFAELAEAYEVLSDVETRKKYNEERYITAKKEYNEPAETIDKKITRINKIVEYLASADRFRINKDALLYSIIQVLPDDVALFISSDKQSLSQFLKKICSAAKYLSSTQTKQLIHLLQPLYHANSWLEPLLQNILAKQQKEESWEKNKIILAVAVAVIICVIIFFVSRK